MSEFDGELATRLDGNVASGLLSEVFRGEPSEALVVCAGCDTAAPIS